jgi:hypothetical protein
MTDTLQKSFGTLQYVIDPEFTGRRIYTPSEAASRRFLNSQAALQLPPQFRLIPTAFTEQMAIVPEKINQRQNWSTNLLTVYTDQYTPPTKQLPVSSQSQEFQTFDGKSPWVFAKTLEHDETTGLPSTKSVSTLIDAVKDCKRIPQVKQSSSSVRAFTGLGSYKTNTLGLAYNRASSVRRDTSVLTPSNSVGDMSDVYAKAIYRETLFSTYSTDGVIDGSVLSDLNSFRGPAVTSANLFRSPNIPGNVSGPFVSQFLMQPFVMGSQTITQSYLKELPKVAESITSSGWLDIQNGKTPAGTNTSGDTSFICNGQMLGSIVHTDALTQFYINAAVLASSLGFKIWGKENMSNNTINTGFQTGGLPNLISALGEVSNQALISAWEQKYSYMRVRPEVFAQRIETIKNNYNSVSGAPYYPDIKTICDRVGSDKESGCANILSKITEQNANSTYYLPLMYPEGSPTHPSYPAGHSVVAGACCTLLKAFYSATNSSGTDVSFSSGVKILTAGNGYTVSSTQNLTGGTGSGATGTVTDATTLGMGVKSGTLSSSGTGYVSGSGAFSGGTGSGAKANIVAAASTGAVSELKISSPGSKYEPGESVLIAGGSGSGLELKVDTIDKDGGIETFSIVNPGTGYILDDSLLGIPSAKGSTFTVTGLVPGGDIESVEITEGGSNYTVGDTLGIDGLGGSGAVYTVDTITDAGGAVSGISISNAGSNYTVGDILTLAQPSGSSSPCTIEVESVKTVNNVTGTIDVVAVLIATGADTMAPYTGSDAKILSLNGELNKLATNICAGRDFAGVHYKSDSEFGMNMGESIAHEFLVNRLASFDKNMLGEDPVFTYRDFSGKVIVVRKR